METPQRKPINAAGDKPSVPETVKNLVVKRRKFLIVAAAFCLLGGTLLMRSHAASFVTAIEAESGQLSGNFGSGPTAGASGGASVTFGASGGGNPSPSPTPTPPSSGNDGVTAAATFNWGTPKYTEDMNDGNNFDIYDTGSRSDFGYKHPQNVSFSGGILTIQGKSDGSTGGMAHKVDQKQGRWEFRAKASGTQDCWRPVGLLWPQSGNWPSDGEVDYAESGGNWGEVNFFLHYGSSNSQTSDSTSLDVTQWNNYAVEWTADHMRGYVNGKQFFEDTNTGHLPPGPMHETFQLDSADGQDSPCTKGDVTWQIDWLHIYGL